MKHGNVYLAGLGTYLPPIVAADSAVDSGHYSDEEHRRNGILGTPVASEDEMPPEMAVHAAKKALVAAGMSATDLDLVLYGGQWDPQHLAPASYVHRGLGARDDVPNLEFRQGCSGAVTMLDMASRYLGAETAQRSALVSTGDRFCLPGWDRYLSEEGYIWGDAASAVILSNEGGVARLLATAAQSMSQAEEVCRGSALVEADRGALPVLSRIPKQRFYKKVGPLSFRRRFQLAVHEVAAQALRDAETEIADVSWALVPNMGLQWRGWALLEPLGIDETRTTWTDHGRYIGHTGLADQTLALEFLLNHGLLTPGSRVLLVAVGVGLTFSSAVLEIVGP